MTNKTETTNTTNQRIFIKGVEHSFRVGEKVSIKYNASLDKPDEYHGAIVTIRDYAPLGLPGYGAAYHVDPLGGWYEEHELEALPEAVTPAHGLKVVLDTPFSGGKGTGCKVKRIKKSLYNDETATRKAVRPFHAAPEEPKPLRSASKPRFKVGDKVVLKTGEAQNNEAGNITIVPGVVYTVTGTTPRPAAFVSGRRPAQFYVALSTSDGKAHGDDHWETSLELAKPQVHTTPTGRVTFPTLRAPEPSLSDLVDRYYQITLEEFRKAQPKPSSKFFLVLSEENEPGGTFDNYALAWQKAVELAKEPGAVPYYVLDLGERLCLTQATVSRGITDLSARTIPPGSDEPIDLVSTRSDAFDHRKRIPVLTPKGHRVYDKITRILRSAQP